MHLPEKARVGWIVIQSTKKIEKIKAVPRYRPKHRTFAVSYSKDAAAVELVVAAAAVAFEGAQYWRLYSLSARMICNPRPHNRDLRIPA